MKNGCLYIDIPLSLELQIYDYLCYPLKIFKTIIRSMIMAKVCQVTGKRPASGYKYAIRGIAKKKKGIGLKVTGKTKRRFQPNLLKKRLWLNSEKKFITLKLSTAALRTIDKQGIEAVVREMRANGSLK
jgi:large subunit ribosomal protein L28